MTPQSAQLLQIVSFPVDMVCTPYPHYLVFLSEWYDYSTKEGKCQGLAQTFPIFSVGSALSTNIVIVCGHFFRNSEKPSVRARSPRWHFPPGGEPPPGRQGRQPFPSGGGERCSPIFPSTRRGAPSERSVLPMLKPAGSTRRICAVLFREMPPFKAQEPRESRN